MVSLRGGKRNRKAAIATRSRRTQRITVRILDRYY